MTDIEMLRGNHSELRKYFDDPDKLEYSCRKVGDYVLEKQIHPTNSGPTIRVAIYSRESWNKSERYRESHLLPRRSFENVGRGY